MMMPTTSRHIVYDRNGQGANDRAIARALAFIFLVVVVV